MGSVIEINDTLKLKKGVIDSSEFEVGHEYVFTLQGRRLFHLSPVRVFLVEEVSGRWNYLGHVVVLEQTIDARIDETRGVFRVTLLYSDTYARSVNKVEPPPGKGWHHR